MRTDPGRRVGQQGAAVHEVEATGLDRLVEAAAEADERLFQTPVQRLEDWRRRWAGWAPLTLTCDEVYVCENPAVLRAATAALGDQAPPLICTEGVPSVAVHTLLRAAARTTIWWRNDVDWTGI